MTSAVRAVRPSLARAEVRRFTNRRFIRVLLALALVGYVLVVGIAAATEFGNPGPQELEQAQAERARSFAESEVFRQQCLDDPGRPADLPVEEYCGPPNTVDSIPIEFFLDKTPFVLADRILPGATAVAAATAAVAFLIGATYVGAEWSSRSMVALLFWEPRRTRVMVVKVGVLVGACAVMSVVAQLLWAGTATLLASTLGETGPRPDSLIGDVLALQARGAVLVVLAGLLGFAISNLARGTGAALGVGFVYFAVVETAVRVVRPRLQEYLLTDSAAGLMTEGGHKIFLFQEQTGTQTEIVVSNLQGGLVLGLAATALIAVGTLLFVRRDLH